MKSEFLQYVLPAVAATFTALVGIYLKNILDASADTKKQKSLTYQKLLGLLYSIKQAEISRLETIGHTYYHEAVWVQEGKKNDSVSLQESRISRNLSIEFSKEVGKLKRELFETLAKCSVLFDDEKLDILIKNVYAMKFGSIEIPNLENLTKPELVDWMKSITPQAFADTQKNIETPIVNVIGRVRKLLTM